MHKDLARSLSLLSDSDNDSIDPTVTYNVFTSLFKCILSCSMMIFGVTFYYVIFLVGVL